MQESNRGVERPKIAPKPVIASKPKYVPPVKLQHRSNRDENTSNLNIPRRSQVVEHKPPHKELPGIRNVAQTDRKSDYRELYTDKDYTCDNKHVGVETNIKYDEYSSTYISEKCDKFISNSEAYKKVEDIPPKAPHSPSTVCCSILSNATTDCCGIINVNKKELYGKSMTKIDSLDSNSSDSGGFKDFIQLDLTKKLSPDKDPKAESLQTHQRKSSHSDYPEKKPPEHKPLGHQRNSSQPDYMSPEVRQSFAQNKQNFIANAQALAQFLPQTEQKILQHKQAMERSEGDFRQQIAKFSTSTTDKTEDAKAKPSKSIITHGQFQQSTKKLEELLSQRLEKEKLMRKGQNCLLDGESSQDVEQKMLIQKQIQQKLQADLQQTVKQIQEIQSIELRLPQNRKWNESSRSQPAIGLKHPPKSRPNCTPRPRKHSQVHIQQSTAFAMDDPDIQETVESILGKGAKVVDCEKKSSIKEEEVLFINGIPVALEGRDGMAIKQALITGQVPPCDLLNTLLIKTGILKAPVKLDTSLSVKSTTVTKEEVTVSRAGKVVDERSRETKEQNFYTTAITEVFEPIKIIPTSELLNGEYSNVKYAENIGAKYYDNNGYETGSENKFGSCSSASSYESEEPTVPSYKPQTCLSKDSGHLSSSVSTTKVDFTQSSIDSLSSLDETDFITDQFRKCTTYNGNGLTNSFQNSYLPTIFGTVASDLTPKDCSNRRSLPQTPQTKSFSTIFNGEASQEGSAESGLQQDNALVYRDGNLVSGPLETLIQHMVPTDVYYPDRAYLFAFLLSSRLFIKPHDLLAKVRNLCETQQGLGNITAGNTHPGQARFAEHLVQLLAEWTETFPYDFRDERMMEHVRKITQQCCAINSTLRASVSSLLHNLHPRLTALEAYEKSLETQSVSLDENCTDISEICPNPAVLAQQLTHVELERLSFIGPEEFVQAFAKENPNLETSFKDMKKTHNLEQYVQWFNRLSYFVATQVCKYQKKKMRVRVVEFWIETGRECFNIGNFNSLMAIIAGLNMSPISRLKKTWSKIQSGKFAILEHQMDPSSNFSSYRSTLKAAMWRSAGATDQRQRIVIPFFSLLVKDLYFLNQGCANRLPNGHINFEKFWQLAKQVTEFMAWKQVTCPFEKDPKIISLLQHGPILNENALALASFECEPPDNNQEKERCKTLKADVTTTN